MRALKIILITLVVLVVVLVAVSFLLPREVHVERSTTINAPPEVVYAQINNLKNWELWSPWHKLDPNMAITYGDTIEGEGAWYAWESDEDNVGRGKLTITEARPYEVIKTDMDFMEHGTAHAFYNFEEAPEGTKLTWGFDSDMGNNPMARYMGLMMDKFIGSDYEKGLAAIKEISESKSSDFTSLPDIEVEEINLAPQWFVVIGGTTDSANIGPTLGRLYGEINSYMNRNNIQASGMPAAFYHYFTTDSVVLEAGMPVKDSINVKDNQVKLKRVEGKAVTTMHQGDYANMGATYEALQQWMSAKNYQPSAGPWEHYITDPGEVTDTTQWQTRIFWPVM